MNFNQTELMDFVLLFVKLWRTRLLFFMEDLTVAPAKSFCHDISFDIGIMTLYYALS